MLYSKIAKIGWLVGLVFLLVACSSDEDSSKNKEVNLAYVEWDTEVASTHVIGQVLEDLGYDVTLTALDNAIMWKALSTGEVDGMVSAWLPKMHAPFVEEFKEDIVDLGENLTGAKIGMVVPTYMKVDSIEDLTNEADQTITAIEPGANMTLATENAYKDYPNLEGWTVLTSSGGAMTAALKKAIENNEEIIVTGWSPHWKFTAFDLKYLDDPKGIYGEDDYIGTFARKGFKEEQPEAYRVLDNFYWTAEDIESVMYDIMEGTTPKEAAKRWINEHPEKVAEWTEK